MQVVQVLLGSLLLGCVRTWTAPQLLNQHLDGFDEDADVEDDDANHRTNETPDEAMFQRQPAAKRDDTEVCVRSAKKEQSQVNLYSLKVVYTGPHLTTTKRKKKTNGNDNDCK